MNTFIACMRPWVQTLPAFHCLTRTYPVFPFPFSLTLMTFPSVTNHFQYSTLLVIPTSWAVARSLDLHLPSPSHGSQTSQSPLWWKMFLPFWPGPLLSIFFQDSVWVSAMWTRYPGSGFLSLLFAVCHNFRKFPGLLQEFLSLLSLLLLLPLSILHFFLTCPTLLCNMSSKNPETGIGVKAEDPRCKTASH